MNLAVQSPVVLDIAGTELTADDRRRLQHPLTGGLVLFARNWVDRRQLTMLLAQAKSVRPDLLICVDHEGGRVQRFRTDGFTSLPAMRRLGELWMRDALLATDAVEVVARSRGNEHALANQRGEIAFQVGIGVDGKIAGPHRHVDGDDVVLAAIGDERLG